MFLLTPSIYMLHERVTHKNTSCCVVRKRAQNFGGSTLQGQIDIIKSKNVGYVRILVAQYPQ